MDSSLKLFCSWVLLMTQPLRLLGNNSGNLSTATTPFTIAYMVVSSLDKKCHWHLALKKRLQGFLHNTVFDVKWGWKVRKKARLVVHAKRLMPYFRSSKSDIQSFFYESISVLQSQVAEGKKSIFATFLSCIDNSILPSGTERQTSTEPVLPKIYDCQITLLIIPSSAGLRGEKKQTRMICWE